MSNYLLIISFKPKFFFFNPYLELYEYTFLRSNLIIDKFLNFAKSDHCQGHLIRFKSRHDLLIIIFIILKEYFEAKNTVILWYNTPSIDKFKTFLIIVVLFMEVSNYAFVWLIMNKFTHSFRI